MSHARQRARAARYHKAVTYGEWGPDALAPAATFRTLSKLQGLGVDTVIIPVAWTQPSLTANGPRRDRSVTVPEANLIAALDSARQLGLKAILRPYIDIADRRWRGTIVPRDVRAWFTAYGSFQRRYADIAQAHHADGLIIGLEMVSMSKYAKHWRALVTRLRQRFSGWLSYQANWDEAVGINGRAKLRWWDALDAISVSAYFPLASASNPSFEDVVRGWTSVTYGGARRNWHAALRKLSRQQHRPVFLAELGYRTRADTAVKPWETTPGFSDYDEQAQADAYEAALRVWYRSDFSSGMAWWFVNRSLGQPDQAIHGGDHAPTAESLEVLRSWYAQPR